MKGLSQQPLSHFSCKKVDVAEKVLAHGEEWTTVLDQKKTKRLCLSCSMSLYESLWYWWISPWLEATLEPVMESWAPHQRRPWARERDGVGPNDPLHTWQNAVDIQISQNHQTSRWNWTERILCFWHSTRASHLGAVSGASFPSGKGSTWEFKADPVTMPSLWIAPFPNFP